MRKPTIWVLTRSDTNQPVQSQKKARSLKRDHTICVAKTRLLITFVFTAKLICVFVFAYADCCFSHALAQLAISEPSTKDSYSLSIICRIGTCGRRKRQLHIGYRRQATFTCDQSRGSCHDCEYSYCGHSSKLKLN